MEDSDNDNDGDKPLINVFVALVDGDDHVVETKTDENGEFILQKVPIGEYVVTQQNLPGYDDVSDADGINDNRVKVRISADHLDATEIFFVDKHREPKNPRNTATGSISGRVTEDIDNDGKADKALDGVLVTLLEGKDGNRVIATTLTHNRGTYAFGDIPPGVYTVKEENLPNYVDVSDVYHDNDSKIPVWIMAPDRLDHAGKNFVNKLVGQIKGKVTEDVDNDSVGDKPLVNIMVALVDKDDHVAETTTNDNGEYEFSEVPMGEYDVTAQNLPEYVDVADSDGTNDNTISVKLSPDTVVSVENNFVDRFDKSEPPPEEVKLGSIGGRVTEDINNDGAADKALDGVLITLYKGRNGDQVVATTTTHNRGTYSFNDLPIGVYTVHETNLPNYVDVSDVYHDNDSKVPVWITPTNLDHSGKNFGKCNEHDLPLRSSTALL